MTGEYQTKQCFLVLFFLLLLHAGNAQENTLHTIRVKSPAQLQTFFSYSADRVPFVSAHRGGARARFPENCLATFENTLRYTHAVVEIDPRLTKDSVIVLMHDATLDRTTNGSGKVSDHTWEELRQLRLKDTEGNITDYRIPTLDEALSWAKGKTILILDKKSVPFDLTEKKIREHKAEAWAMVMAYSYEEAKQYYTRNPDIMMEVFIPDRDRLKEFEKYGVPWKNVVAFIAHARPDDKGLYDEIHSRGVMCIVGSSRVYDKEYLNGKLDVYTDMIREGVDIIEADLAIEAGEAIQVLNPSKSSKKRFFRYPKALANTSDK